MEKDYSWVTFICTWNAAMQCSIIDNLYSVLWTINYIQWRAYCGWQNNIDMIDSIRLLQLNCFFSAVLYSWMPYSRSDITSHEWHQVMDSWLGLGVLSGAKSAAACMSRGLNSCYLHWSICWSVYNRLLWSCAACCMVITSFSVMFSPSVCLLQVIITSTDFPWNKPPRESCVCLWHCAAKWWA